MLESNLSHSPLTITRSSRFSFPVTGRLYRQHAKRLMDISICLLLVPVVIPLLILLGFAVRSDGGRALFGHLRVGRDGRLFRCWKLRTMCENAEERLKSHLSANPEAALEWAANQKLSDDPRVTRLGKFLRSTSLDELPQIWNVLAGEMSLVGPRPVTEQELIRYGVRQQEYLSVLPGITGLWQVSGRNGTSYEQRVRLDALYARSVNFWIDLKILFRTARVVLQRSGI